MSNGRGFIIDEGGQRQRYRGLRIVASAVTLLIVGGVIALITHRGPFSSAITPPATGTPDFAVPTVAIPTILDSLSSSSDIVLAQELKPYEDTAQGPSLDDAATICPALPEWSLVMRSPTSYRGRCVFLDGFVQFASGPDIEFRLNATDQGQTTAPLWIRFEPASGISTFWGKADTARDINVLGTLQGVKNGLPYIDAQEVYYYDK